MNRSLVVSIVLGLAMAATSALTGALTPQPRAPLAHERFDLAQMIPLQFGIWTVDPSVVPLTPNPEQQGMLEKIYDQTLSRTYADPQGQRVMLSIAYGGDQSKSLQLHLPEVCYVAQGFEMVQEDAGVLPTRYAQVPVTRLVARLHERNEPITYWITIGDKATRTGIEQKLRRLAFGLSGEVPDGMLVRVSTVGNDARSSWRVQDRFVADMLAVLAPRDRARLIGNDVKPAEAAAVARKKTGVAHSATGSARATTSTSGATATSTATGATKESNAIKTADPTRSSATAGPTSMWDAAKAAARTEMRSASRDASAAGATFGVAGVAGVTGVTGAPGAAWRPLSPRPAPTSNASTTRA